MISLLDTHTRLYFFWTHTHTSIFTLIQSLGFRRSSLDHKTPASSAHSATSALPTAMNVNGMGR